jgi:hypothetical protein
VKPYSNLRNLEHLTGLTWHELVGLEPRLGDLLWRARQACVRCRRGADIGQVFLPIRDTLAGLVGFAGKHHAHPVLGSARAYAVAGWKLYDAVAGLLPGRADTAAAPEKPYRKPGAEPPPSESASAAIVNG